MTFLGIDIGSSFIKSALLNTGDFTLRDIRKVRTAAFAAAPDPLIREIDPEEIYASAQGIIDGYLQDYTDIAGICFSTQMHGFVLMDSLGGSISNYVTWQDERATQTMKGSDLSYLDRIGELLNPDELTRTGTRVKPSLGMCNLFHWIQNNIMDREAWFCTLGDYVIARLSGESPVSHPTNAAATGLMDLEAGDWNPTIRNKLGFDSIQFPKIVEETSVCGSYRLKGRDVPLYPAVADHQAAMFGAFLRPERDLAINVGTGSQLCVATPHLSFGEYETRPFFGGHFLKTICHIPAGRALNVLVNFIQDIGSTVFDCDLEESALWEKITLSMRNIQKTDLDTNIAFFRTATVPYGGWIRNIHEGNLTVANLFHGAFAGMALTYHDLHTRLLDNGERIEKIVCTGGLIRKNPILLKLIETNFGSPSSLLPHEEDTLVGLLRIASGVEQMAPDGEPFTSRLERSH